MEKAGSACTSFAAASACVGSVYMLIAPDSTSAVSSATAAGVKVTGLGVGSATQSGIRAEGNESLSAKRAQFAMFVSGKGRERGMATVRKGRDGKLEPRRTAV